jgi:hypothetical protein
MSGMHGKTIRCTGKAVATVLGQARCFWTRGFGDSSFGAETLGDNRPGHLSVSLFDVDTRERKSGAGGGWEEKSTSLLRGS